MNYMKELLGNRYLSPSDWGAKKAREAEEFKVRLASLSKPKATETCVKLLAMAEGVPPDIRAIATEYLSTKT